MLGEGDAKGCKVVHLDLCSAVVGSNVSPHYLCVLLIAATNGHVNQCHSSSFPITVLLCMVHTLQLPMSHLTKQVWMLTMTKDH
jgi:hypothetical protein